MEHKLAFIKSANQYILIQSGENQQAKVMNIESLEDNKELHGLLCPEGEMWTELNQLLAEMNKKIPVRSSQSFNLNLDNIERVSDQQLEDIIKKSYESWILANNITLLDELSTLTSHLVTLYPNDRSTFFEELWFILKRNLGTSKLTLIYNDIILGKKEGEKNKLIQANLTGEISPLYQQGGEAEKTIFDNYKKDIDQYFQLAEYDADKNQFVAHCSLQDSPIIIMGHSPAINKLQTSLIKAVFDLVNNRL